MAEVKVDRGQSQTGQAVTRRSQPDWGLDLHRPFSGGRNFFEMNPFALMREFTNEMDKMFAGSLHGAARQWAPSIDVRQCDNNLVVSAELPGLKKDDVKVELTDDSLIIQGERKQEHKEDHEGFHRYERSYGHFYRAIPLPQGARTDEARADLADGVLKITVPVPDMKKKSRQIPVSEGEKVRTAGG